MFYDLVIFTPAAVCLFWLLLNLLMSSRTDTYHPLIIGLVVMTFYLYTDSCFASPHTPFRTLAYSDIIAQFVAPAMLPLIWMYLKRLQGQKRFTAYQILWIVFPVALGATAVTLTLIAGPDRIIDFQSKIYAGELSEAEIHSSRVLYAYHILLGVIFRFVLLAEAIFYGILLFSMILRENIRLRHLVKFFKGGRLRVLELQVFIVITTMLLFIPKMILQHEFLMEHPWISMVLAVLISIVLFFFCYVSLYGARKTVTLKLLAQGFTFNYNKENKDEILSQNITDMVEDMTPEALQQLQIKIRQNLHLQSSRPEERKAVPVQASVRPQAMSAAPPTQAKDIYTAVAKNWTDEGLLSRFEQLMIRKQCFLEPGLTLTDVAERLHSNKTYVSRMINSTYEMAFPDLLNTLRVDYAEKYILAHRDARQQEIAEACGFASASSFNNIFKKTTGMTPKIWLAAYDQQRLLADEPAAIQN